MTAAGQAPAAVPGKGSTTHHLAYHRREQIRHTHRAHHLEGTDSARAAAARAQAELHALMVAIAEARP